MAKAGNPRGADIVAGTLAKLGVKTVFTLSGNHIMPVFDAALDAGLDLLHVRHEAAAVHMADAFGRLTGRPGVALVTGGPGHANAAAALFTALGAESPMVLLSGHAALWEVGRGGFQELEQAQMAAPAAKASFTSVHVERLGADIATAFAIATSGRPGPVHLSLPVDLLEQRVATGSIEQAGMSRVAPEPPSGPQVDAVLERIAAARKPVILAGPAMSGRAERALLDRLEKALGVPAAVIESPRGLADASLGAFPEMIAEADLVVLFGKALDFTSKWLAPPVTPEDCPVIALEPEERLLSRAKRELQGRLVLALQAPPVAAAEALLKRAKKPKSLAWLEEARRAKANRPAEWMKLASRTKGKLHPIEVCRAVRPVLEADAEAVLVCDGGEFAQWAQSLLPINRRIINSVSGSIGASIPFAIAARTVEAKAPIIAILGDGTFGFHMAEVETAVRRNLPFIAIIGNDAAWNAERQIQLREYGAQRAHGCELTAARYDLVAEGLGGRGWLVTTPAEMAAALDAALASGCPCVINVMLEGQPAPIVRRAKA